MLSCVTTRMRQCLRNRALAALAAAPADERRLLELYTRGVNDGLSALSARPFEYLLLRETPSPWRPEDSALVAYAMYIDLQYRELESTVARAISPCIGISERKPIPDVR